jgi:hypothetical protein
VVGVIAFAPAVLAQLPCPCELPDNGSGTITMPPGCPEGYEGQMEISSGLPANNLLSINARLSNFQNVAEVPGGNLGGTVSTFDALLMFEMQGSGNVFNGFSRLIHMPVTGEVHWAPRTLNDPVQTFGGEIVQLAGSVLGDPDFDSLAFRAGSDFGLNSAGSSTLTRVGGLGGPFVVDSFFDVTYEIEFVGAPGSILDGLAGTTMDVGRLDVCPGGPVPVENTSWGRIKTLYK